MTSILNVYDEYYSSKCNKNWVHKKKIVYSVDLNLIDFVRNDYTWNMIKLLQAFMLIFSKIHSIMYQYVVSFYTKMTKIFYKCSVLLISTFLSMFIS